MENISLQDLVRQYVKLDPKNTKGWEPCVHRGCDHGKKGPRAAFRFEGESVAFHCFNCSVMTEYDPEKHSTMPQKMKQVLSDFGIEEDEWQPIIFKNFNLPKNHKSKHTPPSIIEPPEIHLPEQFYYLKDATPDDKWAIIAEDYLFHDRGISPSNYPFMLMKQNDDPKLKKWNGRLIIPIFKDKKLIFYIGRDLTNKKMKKYDSPAVSKDAVLYGFDKIFEPSNLPLYIVEGWFDAFSIDGIAILGNELSQQQIKWINKSNRQKVYVPDRFGNGRLAAEKALKQGWYVSTPDIGSSCKDMNDAVKKYGKLYVMKTLADNISTGTEAFIKLRVYCEN